jgi:hypothetical protein
MTRSAGGGDDGGGGLGSWRERKGVTVCVEKFAIMGLQTMTFAIMGFQTWTLLR